MVCLRNSYRATAIPAAKFARLGLFLLALLGGCSDSVSVVINVAGITPDLYTLQVSAALDGRQGVPGEQQLDGEQQRGSRQ